MSIIKYQWSYRYVRIPVSILCAVSVLPSLKSKMWLKPLGQVEYMTNYYFHKNYAGENGKLMCDNFMSYVKNLKLLFLLNWLDSKKGKIVGIWNNIAIIFLFRMLVKLCF